MFSGGEVKNIQVSICATDKFNAGAEKDQCEASVQACAAASDEGTCTTENIDSNAVAIKLALLEAGDSVSKAAKDNFDNFVTKVKGIVKGSADAAAPAAAPVAATPVAKKDDDEDSERFQSTINSGAVCSDYMDDDGDDWKYCKIVAKTIKAYCNGTAKTRGAVTPKGEIDEDSMVSRDCKREEAKGEVTEELKKSVVEWVTEPRFKKYRDKLIANENATQVYDDDNKTKAVMNDLDKFGAKISAETDHPVVRSGFHAWGLVGTSLGTADVSSKRASSGLGRKCPTKEDADDLGIDPTLCQEDDGKTNFADPSSWDESVAGGAGAGYLWNVGSNRFALGVGAEVVYEKLSAADARSADLEILNLNAALTAKFQLTGDLSLRADFLVSRQTITAKADDEQKLIIDNAGERIDPDKMDLTGLALGGAVSLGYNFSEYWGAFIQLRRMDAIKSTFDRVGTDREDQGYKESVIPAKTRYTLFVGPEFTY